MKRLLRTACLLLLTVSLIGLGACSKRASRKPLKTTSSLSTASIDSGVELDSRDPLFTAEGKMHSGETFKITTFNVRNFGTGGNFGWLFRDEFRQNTLREFVLTHLSDSDVIVFEEILAPDMLQESLNGLMKCHTYQDPEPKHLHVVLCHQPQYDFKPLASDPDFKLDSVKESYALDLKKTTDAAGVSEFSLEPSKTKDQSGKLLSARGRPALHGMLLDADGLILSYVIGVHLKSSPDGFYRRVAQAKEIAKDLKAVGSDIPVILLGDFNIYEGVAKLAALDREIQKLKSGIEANEKKIMDLQDDLKKNVLNNLTIEKEISDLSGKNQESALWIEKLDLDRTSDVVNRSDIDLMEDIFNRDYQLGLTRIKNDSSVTFKSPRYQNLFDHIWVSESLPVAGADQKAHVFERCADSGKKGIGRFFDELYYYQFISDHCPVTAELSIYGSRVNP